MFAILFIILVPVPFVLVLFDTEAVAFGELIVLFSTIVLFCASTAVPEPKDAIRSPKVSPNTTAIVIILFIAYELYKFYFNAFLSKI